MVSSGKSWVLIDCILVGIKETKLTTFDFKIYGLKNNLLQ